MKTIAVLMLLVTGLGCAKYKCDADPQKQSGIAGKWEIRKAVGGIAGIITYPQGNGTVYEFRHDGTYRFQLSGSTVESGTYTITNAGSPATWTLVLTTSSSVHTRTIRIDGENLVFLKELECCDYPDVYFVRIN